MFKTYNEAIHFLASTITEAEFHDGMSGGYGHGGDPAYGIKMISYLFNFEESKVKKDYDKVKERKQESLHENWALAVKGQHKF